MADTQLFRFDEYLQQDLEQTAGLRYPVKAGWLEQLLTRKVSPWKLHANATDLFCSPSVGPNHGIIQKYIQGITHNMKFGVPIFAEPLIIEKMRPNGYLLLNGHHRWAAALRLNVKKVPVQLVNMTHVPDIAKVLEKSTADRRASINLDDVVFCTGDAEPAEKMLPFPARRFFKERIRLGIPALFHALHEQGYDVWVYTAGYASTDYISRLLKRYHIHADGIVNGANRLKDEKDAAAPKVREMLEKKYRVTLHIDTDSVVRIHTDQRDFEQEMIDAGGDKWSARVISIVRGFKEK